MSREVLIGEANNGDFVWVDFDDSVVLFDSSRNSENIARGAEETGFYDAEELVNILIRNNVNCG